MLVQLTFLLFCVNFGVDAHPWSERTLLDDYVHRDDGHWSWEILTTDDSDDDYILWSVNMTSQKWFSEDVSSQPIWWHYMAIACPRNIRYPNAAFMHIDGGSMGSSPPDGFDTASLIAGQFANISGMCGGVLRMVPNQPIIFTDDPLQRVRSEDSIIAYTWRKLIENTTANPEFILQFPQTKAGKRGLDTIAAVAAQERPETNINEFLVAGASKRGWTAWLVGATDQRVKGMAPMVISCLNFQAVLMHHYQSLGNWSHALASYYNENLTQYLDHPRTGLLMDLIDPYAYRVRLTMPKIIISGAGDEFFLVDDSHYFFDTIPEPKYMLLLENTNHGMDPHYPRIFEAVAAFAQAILTDFVMPQLQWQRNETADAGTITLWTDRDPTMITGWVATTLEGETPIRRDFRMTHINENGTVDLHPVFWDEVPVDILDENVYFLEQPKEPGRWRAFFIQAEFEGPERIESFDFTTEVNIIPDVMPYPPCSGIGCWGSLV